MTEHYTIANLFYGEDIKQWNIATPFFSALWDNSYLSEYDYGYSVEEGNPVQLWLDSESDDLPAIIYPYKGISCGELDMLYLNRSGDKLLTKRVIKKFEYALEHNRTNTPYINELATQITRLYSQRWRGIWETMFYEYDPIENYNMIEEMIDDEKVTDYGRVEETENNLTHLKTGSEVDTPGVTTTETDQIYGFGSDSDDPVNSNKRITRPTGTDTHQYNNVSDKDTGTQTVSNSGTDTETRNYKLTRSGIGNSLCHNKPADDRAGKTIINVQVL